MSGISLRSLLLAGLAVLLLVGGAGDAQAQRRPDAIEVRIADLEKQLAELKDAAVQVPTVAEGVRSVSEQLAVLKQQVETLGTQQKTIPDAVAVMDQLSQRTVELEAEMASLRTRIAGLEQPSTGGGTGGGGVSYASGFRLTSDDGAYSLTLDGYLQARYELVLDEGLDDIDDQGLRIRRGRIGAKGTIASPALSFRLLTELTASRPLLDYYVDYQIKPQVAVRFGQYKVWFDRNYITSSTKLVLPERQAAVESFRYDRDIQVGLMGEVASDRVGYYVGIGNGAGVNRGNDNIDILAVARADVAIVGERVGYDYGDLSGSSPARLTVGAAVTHDLVAVPDSISGIDLVTDVDGVDGRDNVQVISATADAIVRYQGLEVAAEWLFRREDWGTILEGQVDPSADLADVVGVNSARTYHGLAAQAAYTVRPKQLLVGLGLTYGNVPFLGVSGRSSAVPLGRKRLEVDGLVQLYSGAGRLLGLQYTLEKFSGLYDADDSSRDVTHRVVLETQLKF